METYVLDDMHGAFRALKQVLERSPVEQIKRHFRTFFAKQQPYFEDEAGSLYVHGGYEPGQPIAEQDPYSLIWNRTLWRNGLFTDEYRECFIGHTPTWPASAVPCLRANVWNLDQGAAYGGLLSLLNVRAKEFVQSDVVQTLYPGVKGR